MAKRGRKVGVYSSPDCLAQIDLRTREGRIIAQVRADLTLHVGGRPSATQLVLIERAARLTLQIAMLDAKMSAPGGLTEHDHRTYLAWTNALTRLMRQLGANAAPQRPMTPSEALAAHPLTRASRAA